MDNVLVYVMTSGLQSAYDFVNQLQINLVYSQFAQYSANWRD